MFSTVCSLQAGPGLVLSLQTHIQTQVSQDLPNAQCEEVGYYRAWAVQETVPMLRLVPSNLPAESSLFMSPEVVSAPRTSKSPVDTRTFDCHWMQGSGQKRPLAIQKDQGSG